MSDLISRQAAIDALSMMQGIVAENGVRKGISMAWQQIKDLPSAQQEPKKGKWIHDGFNFPQGVDWVHCSVCGRKGINVPADLTNFCPNCGADMREKEE